MLRCRTAFILWVVPMQQPVRYPISNPPVSSYKRLPIKPPATDDVEVYRQLTTTKTSIDTLTLRSENEELVTQTPWLRAAFWSRLAEFKYLESEAA